MAALSLNNNRRQSTTTTTTWSTQQRQQLFVRKQFSLIETGGSSVGGAANHNTLHISSNRGGGGAGATGRGSLTRGLSVGRSYDGIRHKLNAPPSVSLRHAGSQSYLQRQLTFDQDLKFKSNTTKTKENFIKNSRSNVLSNSNTRLNYTQRSSNNNSNGDNLKLKQKSIVAWSSTSSLLKSIDHENNFGYLRQKNLAAADVAGITKVNDTRKASTTTSNTSNLHHHQQRSHSLAKGEASKINLSIVLPQASKTSIDETVFSDIESSLDSGVDTDTASSQPSKSLAANKSKIRTLSKTTPVATASQISNSSNNTAGYKRAQFRASRIDASTILTSSSLSPTIATTSATTATASINLNNAAPKQNLIQNSQLNINAAVNQTISTTATNAPAATTITTTNFNASPSLIVQRRPPLVRAMSAPVRPLNDSSKGAFVAAAANKRKPRRRKIITTRNISCDKTNEEEEFLTIFDGKKVLTRSRSAVSTDVVTLVSLMSSDGSDDSDKEDTTQPTTTQPATAAKSVTSPVRRAPSLRKTGKSVSFQENYPPNFQLASKEYSHMIRRASIAPLTTRLRSNRPPTAPPVSIFLNLSNSNTEVATSNGKVGYFNADSNIPKDNGSDNTKRIPNNREMSSLSSSSNTEQNYDYVFPDYVRSIKERECWKLYQKMCNKGVNVSYDTILRGMLTPTEFRQIQKQRELEEEAKARELTENAENADENVKPQSAIDRLSEALLKK